MSQQYKLADVEKLALEAIPAERKAGVETATALEALEQEILARQNKQAGSSSPPAAD